MAVLPLSPALDPEIIRKDFPILRKRLNDPHHRGERLVYLDNASTTQPPRQVTRAMLEVYARHYSNVHRGTYCLAERTTKRYEVTREKVRVFLNARSPEEVIFTSGTTMGINLVARSWGDANVRQGNEILLSEMEHHSNIVPWQQLAQRTGAILKYIPVTEDGRLDLEAMDRLLSHRTKLVGVTGSSNVLGTVNPVEEIVPSGALRRGGRPGRRCPKRATPENGRDGHRHRFSDAERAQDAGSQRRGGAVRAARTAGGHAAVPDRGRHDPPRDARQFRNGRVAGQV